MGYIDIIDYIFWGLTAVLCVIAFVIGKSVRRWQDFGIVEDYKERGKLALLKPMYIAVGSIIFAPLIILFFSLLDDIADIPTNKMITPSEVRNLALAFVGTISGIGALFAGYLAILRSEENKRQNDVAKEQSETAIQQSKIAEQGQITDRLNKATENLGKGEADNPVLEVRLGALYALERIAQDSIRDHIQIMEILCAYIRTNSPRTDELKKLREDIQAALTIIGRRDKWTNGKKYLKKETEQKYFLDLRNCNLQDALLANANLSNALLDNTTLSQADLKNTNLSYAKLNDADLSDSEIGDTNLIYAKLVKANLNNCNFANTDMRCTNLNDARIDNALFLFTKMEGAYAYSGDFSKAPIYAKPKFDVMYCGDDFIIGKDDKRPKHWPDIATLLFESDHKEWLNKTYPNLAKNFPK